jgi:hypothetical protein
VKYHRKGEVMDEPQPRTEDEQEYARKQTTKRGLAGKDLLPVLTDGASTHPDE